jgi:hypothetical protein
MRVMKARTTPTMWMLCALLAAMVRGGVEELAVRLRPSWVAKYHGNGAERRSLVGEVGRGRPAGCHHVTHGVRLVK